MGIGNLLAKGVAKDYAKKAASKALLTTGKPGTLGKLKDKLAKARLEYKQHSASESWHKHLAARVIKLNKEVEEYAAKATPKTANKPERMPRKLASEITETPMSLKKQAE